ncbi:MAG TPA: hydantoinase/oxoprolinase family protein [Solirubrobacteraceae bacterium]|jgi:N-methylhydantoinase A|nr:hydantoinase/oxoprolinase family protein [Solirubrobacteraceae bacterium]
MDYYLGVDIGGTFTDCVAVGQDGRVLHAKAPSTTASGSATDGVLAGLELLAGEAGIPLAELLAGARRFSHGTTIGTNLVVERKGARVGLLATAGHGDALLMMRGNGRTAGLPVDRVFSVHRTDKPAPLVPRRRTAEIDERVAADGEVIVALDEARAREAVRALLELQEPEAIAIALLWSVRNPGHELRLRELVLEARPDLFVSCSHETSPRQGEYERTVATVVNAYVGPASGAYLGELAQTLRERGLSSEPLIMQASGGVVPVEVARRLPLETIGSGPAGGLAGTVSIAAASGHEHVIATDMGGTSFEVGLVVDGRALLASEQVIDQYTFRVPQLDVRSIACGGGSIAWVDRHSGSLRVGPESAGALPGPACYGRGGPATVTDADVVLGLLDPETFLGGRMQLDGHAARQVIGELASELGLGLEQTAAGIVQVNSFSAATLIRQRTIEQGLDPRDFALYAFGGAGPLHAFAFARELGVAEVVIPLGNGASTLSAFGIAATDVVRTFEQECRVRAPFDAGELAAAVAALEARARSEMAAAGFDEGGLVLERTALMRYAEQYLQELLVPIASGAIDEGVAAALAGDFDAEYVRLYSEGARAIFQAVEVFALRVSARVPLGFAPLHAGADGAAPEAARSPDGERQVFWPESGEWTATAVHDGGAVRAGERVVGPALIELPHTTVAVAAGASARRDALGNLIMQEG